MARHKMRNRPERKLELSQERSPDRGAQRAALKAARVLELPVDLVAGMVHFEFSGNREVIIEGCRGILEYDENIICIDTGKMTVRFMGRGLELRNFTNHSAVIDGFISSVEFLT
jgi:sporulation protein YqfC